MKILQIENVRDNGYFPGFNDPSVNVVDLSPLARKIYPAMTTHASDVAERLLGVRSQAKALANTLFVIEASNYFYGFLNSRIPKCDWQVENLSFGAATIDNTLPLAQFDKHIADDNVVACVAVPDSGMGYGDFFGRPAPRQLFSINKNAINVGSSNGGVDILPGSRVDIVTDEPFTSYGAPVVAAAAAVLIDLFLKAGKAYRFSDIRKLLLDGADAMPDTVKYGRGRLNLARSRSLAQAMLGTQPPVVIPPPVPDTVPVPTPTPTAGYKFFRLDLKSIASGNVVQISKLALRKNNSELAWPTGTTVVPLNASYRPGNSAEGAANLIDGSVNTKYCDINFIGDTQLLITSPTPIDADALSLFNANDTANYPGRVPTGWILSGSNDKTKWTVLQTKNASAPSTIGNYASIGLFPFGAVTPPPPPPIVQHSDTVRLDYAISAGLVPSRDYLDLKIG